MIGNALTLGRVLKAVTERRIELADKLGEDNVKKASKILKKDELPTIPRRNGGNMKPLQTFKLQTGHLCLYHL